jgi:hypothetical protein
MDENNKFALVPRPPSEIEKAEPGAKRVLSGMVADTLALARIVQPDIVICTVLIGDDTDGVIPSYLKILPAQGGFERFDFRPINFKSASDLQTSTQKQPFDLIVINFTRVRWDVPNKGIDPFDDVVHFLGRVKSKYDKPIIVVSTLEDTRLSAQRFAQVGVSYFPWPICGFETFQTAVEDALQIPARRAP